MRSLFTLVLAALVTLVAEGVSRADVKLPAVFGDHMVLQQGHELPFWGWAEPGELVTVTVAGKPVMATAAADGRWSLRHPAVARFGLVDVTIVGKNSVTLKDVLVGDVWFCSGQSNMQLRVSESASKEEIPAAKFPTIRLFQVERQTALEPQSDVQGKWVECSPDTVGDFSAVAYSFGRELHSRLNHPVGLIEAAYSGCGAESWVSDATLKSDPLYVPLLEKTAAANKDPAQANTPGRATVLYNGVIAPLQPFAIKGAIFYQGEQNAVRAHQYRTLFPALIEDWRRTWGQGDFPFLFVQLPNYIPDKTKPDHAPDPEASAWAELRDAQRHALSAPNTGMAVTIDLGDPRDIHPKNKQEVGRRLARQALSVAYNQSIVASGPLYRSMTIAGNEVHLQFYHVGSGLVARGTELRGFAISGTDQKFVWARATIVGSKIVVTSDQVSQPVAVRYAWADNPDCNLYNKEGYPASPFRTDDWPGVTFNVLR
ncbi:MAG: sialate O-acetylesterase [Planctomycetes bacterium]|nr:sialate O-acetylesterase [Planctomycetota bacterium]